MAGTFELYKDKAGEFRFRLNAGNGNTILASEGYKTRASAEAGIESVRKNAGEDARYDRKTGASGKFSFALKAANGQIVGTSQTYDAAAARDKGVESVKAHAADAKLSDLTA